VTESRSAPIPDDPWWREFIAELPARTAKLATVLADGGPHVAPVWVALDGDDLLFNTGADTVKGRALRRDPRVALAFDDERPPFSFVQVRGTASISEDPGELLRWATIIAGRYMGAEQADAYGRRNAVPGELLVRVTPTRVVAARDIAD
jgi:PPOX class probable F420-dependent enzyme